MAFSRPYNIARVEVTSSGTGTLVLGSAVPGFLSFADSGVPDGARVSYTVMEGVNTEVGWGIYNEGNQELTRNVIGSTNSNSLISLSGSAQVAVTWLAEDLAPGIAPDATLASAATVDIGGAWASYVTITGTTTITSLGTVANRWRLVRFAGALTLTHHATSLILPGGSNITTAAGDTATFVSDDSGNWRCVDYQYAAGGGNLMAINGATADGDVMLWGASGGRAAKSGGTPAAFLRSGGALLNGAVNMLRDGGRLISKDLGSSIISGDSYTFDATQWNLVGGATQASVGKFIYDNTDYGGSAGSLVETVKDLVDTIRDAGVRRYGPEFWVTEITAGSGTSGSVTIGGVPTYLMFRQNLVSVPPSTTFHCYLRAITNRIWLRRFPNQTIYKWGVSSVDHVSIDPEDDWVSIMVHQILDPYSQNTYGNPSVLTVQRIDVGDKFQFACPALIGGIVDVDPYVGLVASPEKYMPFGQDQDLLTSSSPRFEAIELGHASDTTLSRVSAGVAGIEGSPILTAGVADQGPITGGALITPKDLGNSGTSGFTPNPGDCPMQTYTNTGAHTLGELSAPGYCYLLIVNGSGAGAITTSGWDLVEGDAFTTTDGHMFECACRRWGTFSILTVRALQ